MRDLEQIAFAAYSRLFAATDAARDNGEIDLFDWSKRRAALNRALDTRRAAIADNGQERAAFLTLKGIKP